VEAAIQPQRGRAETAEALLQVEVEAAVEEGAGNHVLIFNIEQHEKNIHNLPDFQLVVCYNLRPNS
jgi:hypothetical protein